MDQVKRWLTIILNFASEIYLTKQQKKKHYMKSVIRFVIIFLFLFIQILFDFYVSLRYSVYIYIHIWIDFLLLLCFMSEIQKNPPTTNKVSMISHENCVKLMKTLRFPYTRCCGIVSKTSRNKRNVNKHTWGSIVFISQH